MSTTSNLADFIDRFAIQMAADLDFYHPVMSGFIEGLKHAVPSRDGGLPADAPSANAEGAHDRDTRPAAVTCPRCSHRVHPPYYCTGTIVYEGCPCFGPLAFIDSAAP